MMDIDMLMTADEDGYEEIGDLFCAIVDAVDSVINGMPSIPTKLEEFLPVLEKQPVPTEKAEAIKECFRKIYGDDDEDIADMNFATVGDIPEEFVGFFLYSLTEINPRLVENNINWSLKEIFESV